jgi:hypothetical protein
MLPPLAPLNTMDSCMAIEPPRGTVSAASARRQSNYDKDMHRISLEARLVPSYRKMCAGLAGGGQRRRTCRVNVLAPSAVQQRDHEEARALAFRGDCKSAPRPSPGADRPMHPPAPGQVAAGDPGRAVVAERRFTPPSCDRVGRVEIPPPPRGGYVICGQLPFEVAMMHDGDAGLGGDGGV